MRSNCLSHVNLLNRSGALGILVIALFVFPANQLFAVDRGLPLTQYLHTSWTQEEGVALPGIQGLAQTTDGYLWLATSRGLIRFDGLRFVHWEGEGDQALPSQDVRALLATADGSLWISCTAGLARLSHGNLTRFPTQTHSFGIVRAMRQDHAGRIWLIHSGPEGMAGIKNDGTFVEYHAADGLPDEKITSVFEDSNRNLWLGTVRRVCRWSPGEKSVCLDSPRIEAIWIGQDEVGNIVVADALTKSILQFNAGKPQTILSGLDNQSLFPRIDLRDLKGNFWVGTAGQGLLRLSSGKVDRFMRRDGLSSDFVSSLLEDREGNLWVGTARGIDRFRNPKALHLSTLDGLSSDVVLAVCATRPGVTWLATGGGGLSRVAAGGQITNYLLDSGLPSTTLQSLYEDSAGRLWAGTTAGLTYMQGNRFVPVSNAKGSILDRVFVITGDSAGAVWLVDSRKGLFRAANRRLEPIPLPEDEKRHIYQLQAGPRGTLWIGYYEGGLTVIEGGATRRVDTDDGLASGAVQAIYRDSHDTIWVGTPNGLSRFQDQRWTTWTRQQGLPEGGVQGIVQDDRNSLWLLTAAGLLKVDLNVLRGATSRHLVPLTFTTFGMSEGLRLAGRSAMANPRVAKAPDGRLWVCTEDGVAIVDPARILGNPVPPPVVIEQLAVDGQSLKITSGTELGFRGREVQIVYTGLSLLEPERVRFRYKLEGVDTNWTDAGTRRSVVYVGLPHGQYRFRVMAANGDGVWNSAGDLLSFRVEPFFYQTWWFAAACIGLIGLSAWGAHRFRVAQVVSRFQLVAQERTRVTRELHDSLLQGFSGVVYQLEAAAKQFDTAPEKSKKRLERAIDQADQSLKEARRAIVSMRLPALETNTLPEALAMAADQLTEGTAVLFDLDVKGRVRQLPYDQQAALYLIGREAITNAVNHARPSSVHAQISYADKEVILTVQDDGRGFDPEEAKAKTDHWGVRGMGERAKLADAAFKLETAPGKGTRVEIRLTRRK